MESHQIQAGMSRWWWTGFVAVCLLALAPSRWAVESVKDAPDLKRLVFDDPRAAPFLSTHRNVIERLKALPEGYKLKAEVQFHWSDDEMAQVPCLVSLTPLDADGKPDGEAWYYGSYYPTRMVPYKHGLKDGVETEFIYPENRGGERRVISETPWREGKIHGIKKLYYHENGKLRMEIPYENGIRQGEEKAYDLPGRLEKVTPYKDDKIHGDVVEYWTSTGKPKRVVPFRKGIVDGIVREYHENGTLKKEWPVKNDRFHGIEKEYDENGKLIMMRYWIEDEIVSKEEYEKKR
jgi:antitoxin component YwqK of YwqJK toxin-antitoxin module